MDAKATLNRLGYTAAEFRRMTGFSVSTLHELLRRRVIAHVRIESESGRRAQIWIPAQAVEDFLARQIPAVEAPEPTKRRQRRTA